ncbi:MAG: ribonuclease P [Candidatus Bathyarchaeia archaeon]
MKNSMRQIARERMEILLEKAIQIHEIKPQLAQRYVELARRIGMKTRVKIPREYRRLICRGCKQFIHPGCTLRVRVKHGGVRHITYTCLRCGRIVRVPIEKRRVVGALPSSK